MRRFIIAARKQNQPLREHLGEGVAFGNYAVFRAIGDTVCPEVFQLASVLDVFPEGSEIVYVDPPESDPKPAGKLPSEILRQRFSVLLDDAGIEMGVERLKGNDAPALTASAASVRSLLDAVGEILDERLGRGGA